MLLVLCLALILNSIFISNQVQHNNLKSRNHLKISSKTHSPTSSNQKLRNERKVLRKSRRNQFKIDVDDWGYDDISDLLQYNYKDVWWTNIIPSTTTKPTTLSTVNVYHRTAMKAREFNNETEFTDSTISTLNLYHRTYTEPIDFTSQATVTQDINKLKNIFKSSTGSLTKANKGAIENVATPKTNVRTNKPTVQPVTNFVDKKKGMYVPIFIKNKDGEFSIVANKTSIFVKRNDNDSNIHASYSNNVFIGDDLELDQFDFIEVDADPKTHDKKEIIKIIQTENVAEEIKKQPIGAEIIVHPKQSAILPSIVKDGLYRIELPDPVTKSTSVHPQNVPVGRFMPPNMTPPQQMLDEALAYYNINRSHSQIPSPYKENSDAMFGLQNLGKTGPDTYYRPQQGNYRERLSYGPNNVGQYGRGPYYNPQYPNNYRPMPFYGQKNLGQYGQGPSYNPQYPSNYRPMPYFSNNLGPYGPGPYNPQNPNNRQRPSYGLHGQFPSNLQNLGNYGRPFYSTKSLKPNAQNVSDNIEVPSHSTNVSEESPAPIHTRKDLNRGRQGGYDTTSLVDAPAHVENLQGRPIAADDLAQMDIPSPSPSVATRSIVQEEFVTKKRRRTRPRRIQDDIGPISPYVKELLRDAKDLHVGPFSIFLIRLFEIVAKKDPEPLGRLLLQAQFECTILYDQEHLLADFGEPFGQSIRTFTNHLGGMAVDVVQSAAVMLHHTMVNRREGLTTDINSVLDHIDSLYQGREGIDLLRVLEDIENYPKGEMDRYQLYRKMSQAMFAPVRRLSGTLKRQILFESLNRVIDNHIKEVPAEDLGGMRRKGRNVDEYSKFTAPIYEPIATDNKIRIYGINDDDSSKTTKRRVRKVTNNIKKYEIDYDDPLKTTKRRVPMMSKSLKNIVTATRFPYISVYKYIPIRTYPKRFVLKNSNKLGQKDNTNNMQSHNTSKIAVNIHNTTTKTVEPKQKVSIKNSKSEIVRTTYSIEPLSQTTIKNMKHFEFSNASAKMQMVNSNIEELKDLIADKILKEKAMDFINKKLQPDVLRNKNRTSTEDSEYSDEDKYEDDSYKDEMAKPETIKQKVKKTVATVETKTPKPFEESLKTTEQNIIEMEDEIQKKPKHFHKKEIRHLRHKHPKRYQKYLKHIKKLKRKKRHKKKPHEQRKKKRHHSKKISRHYKKKSVRLKKKTNKRIKKLKKIGNHLKHNILKHHLVRKNLKANPIVNDTKTDISEEYINDDQIPLYTPFKIAKKKTLETKSSTTSILVKIPTPRYSFVMTPITKNQVTVETSTKKWVHLPIQEIRLDSNYDQIFRVKEREKNKSSLEYHKPDSSKIIKAMKSSSYSDEEDELRVNLNDAMRHDKLRFIPQRRSLHHTKTKDKLRAFSSYSSEEVVLKSNIYKAVGFNNSRANFSEIFRRASNEKGKHYFRHRLKPVNEETSYSDEEDLLRRKLNA